jgi:hypothetical protein
MKYLFVIALVITLGACTPIRPDTSSIWHETVAAYGSSCPIVQPSVIYVPAPLRWGVDRKEYEGVYITATNVILIAQGYGKAGDYEYWLRHEYGHACGDNHHEEPIKE